MFAPNCQKHIGPLADGDVPAVRAILRRLAIERVVVVSDGPSGWRFDGTASLAGLLGSGYKEDQGERRRSPRI